ncbi:MAG: hypothetical protein L0323_10530, partial [Planctomycetes bacterium]|nr:hypothetical protein [Planctomycetota bacterium]
MSEWWRPRRHWERPPGRFLPATYDAHLPLVSSEAQKKIARAWCGTEAYGWKKAECTAGVLRTLEDPAKVRRLVDSLGPYEKKALGLLRSLGGEAAGREFAFEVASLGIEPPDRSSGYGGEAGVARLLNPLIGHGLLLPRWREDRGSWLGGDPRVGYQDTPERVFSDERILRAVEPVAPEPLAVHAVEGPSEGRWRRPGEALLPFLSLAQALARVGPLQTRSHGGPTPAAWRRLSKETVRIAKEDAPLPRTLALALATGLAEFDPFDRRISLSKDARDRLRRPYAEQARGWFDALRSHSALAAEALGTGGGGDLPAEAGGLRGFPFDLDDSAESLAHSLSLR